jgi:hypothetical protein
MTKGNDDRMTCPNCKWLYPAVYLHPMQTSAGTIEPICGICALDLSNSVLGVKRKRFDGQMAEHLRRMAIDWRKRHKDLTPISPKAKP